jgi:hypothetical protein
MVRDLQKEYDSAQQNYGNAIRRFDKAKRHEPCRCRDLIDRARAAEGEEGMFWKFFIQTSKVLYSSRLHLPYGRKLH